MYQHTSFWMRATGAIGLALGCSLLSGGCGIGGANLAGTGATSTTAAAKTGYTGVVHGGQNPVTGATLTLWAAGTTGTYGTGATKIASTTSDLNGNFSFDNVSGSSPCTAGQYLYITATGGNAGGGTNPYIAMMVALSQPCNPAVTGATTVVLNEETTIAAVFALQQFMSINTSATAPYGTGNAPWYIGAPSTNVTGMANAFLQTANVVNSASGISGVTTATNVVGATTFTTTITPDSTKVNALADILAMCINNAADSNGNYQACTGNPSVLLDTTIVSAGNFITPVDTIQAAYNMATLPNPSLTSASGTAAYWKYSTSSQTYLSLLFNNINPQVPFAGYGTAAPNDTAIGVKWQASNGTATVGTVDAASIAIDKTGNVWVGGGSGTTANYITQFNQAGQVLQTQSTGNLASYTFSAFPDSATPTQSTTTANPAYALSYGRPFSLAIDTNNNAWFNAYAVTSPGTVSGIPTGIVAEVTQGGAVNAYLTGLSSGALTIDGSNNLFFNNNPNSPTTIRDYVSELPATPVAAAAPSTAYQAFYEGIGRSTSIYNGVAMDSNNYVWGLSSSTTCTNYTVQRGNDALLSSGASTSTVNAVLPSQCAYFGAGDANGNMWATGNYSATGGSLMYINITCTSCSPAAPIVSGLAAGTGLTNGGLFAAAGLALDGSGNVWVANNASSTSGGLSEFAVAPNSTTGTATITPLSPAGTSSAVYGFGSSYGWLHPNGPVIDSSGNVWVDTTAGSVMNYLVGVASPVMTPIASAVAAGKLAAKP